MSGPLAPPPGFDETIDREWAHLASAGTWWAGEERVAIAREARRAIAGEPPGAELGPVAVDAARTVAADASEITGERVSGWFDRGLDPYAYVEMIGIVARLAAVDTAHHGLGHPTRSLPDPRPGDPSRTVPRGAEVQGGWVPTVGPAGAPNALSAVPAEAGAVMDLHGVLYLSLAEMGDLTITKKLQRHQMELIAARTSRLNDCFY
ncbi:MAG: hypothetical protein ACE5GB_02590 [Acidimicrobiales bacterium]